jgi:hypothetical protein
MNERVSSYYASPLSKVGSPHIAYGAHREVSLQKKAHVLSLSEFEIVLLLIRMCTHCTLIKVILYEICSASLCIGVVSCFTSQISSAKLLHLKHDRSQFPFPIRQRLKA